MSDRCDYEFTTGEACQLESGHPGNHRWAAAQPPSGEPSYIEVRTSACHAGSDGDCSWSDCPQLRDGEPAATGRHCPLASQPPSGDALREALAEYTDIDGLVSVDDVLPLFEHVLATKAEHAARRSQPPALTREAPLDVERLHRAIELAMRADTVTVEAFTAIVARAYAEQDAETLAEKIDREFR